MNKYLNKLLGTLSALLIFSACSTTQEYLSIDYLTPSLVTLPKQANHIAILDNIPEDSTVIKSEILQFISTSRQDIIKGFVNTLAENSFFGQLTILDEKWAEPSKPIPAIDHLEKVAKTIKPDLIFILGKLNVKDENIMISNGDISATSVISIRPSIYIYNSHSGKTTAFQPSDTVNLIEALMLKTIHPSILSKMQHTDKIEGGYIIGKQLAEYLIPHWSTAERTIFSDSPIFSKAHKLLNNNQLDAAIKEYEKIFSENKNIGTRTKAAYNIALTNELKDDLNAALEWSNKAIKTIEENTEASRLKVGSIKDLYKFTLAYQKTIKERIDAIKIINQQMSKFEL